MIELKLINKNKQGELGYSFIKLVFWLPKKRMFKAFTDVGWQLLTKGELVKDFNFYKEEKTYDK